MYCDDWNTDFSGNPTWNADVYALTADNMPNFKYGNPSSNYNVALDSGHNALSRRLKTRHRFGLRSTATWRPPGWTNSGGTSSGTSAATNDTQIELAAAMWTLFVDSSHVERTWSIGAINSSRYTRRGRVNDYLRQAQAAVTNGYICGAGWDVIVAGGSNSFPMQEFLYPRSRNLVP